MARNKALSSFLAIVLVLAIVASLLLASELQIRLTVHIAQEGPSLITAESVAPVAPGLLACGGCSGGGSGPG